MILRLILIIFLFFIPSGSFAEKRLELKDLKELIDLGYNKKDAYADDYSKSKAYWFKLEEHLEIKPKYLALLSQKMTINGKETINQHIYNSKHHFLEIKNQNVLAKKACCWSFNLKKCEFLKPKVIDDTQLTKSTFANMALDHCNETKVKNLKTEDGKILKIKDEKKCSIKFINFSKYELTKVLKKVGKSEHRPKKQKIKSSKNLDLEKLKKQCRDLGFKPRTEKFGECVLRLLEASN